MAFQRVEITRKVVQEALAVAASKDAGVHVWADTQLRYLTIRVRGGSARWTVRAMKTMKVVGDLRERHPEFLSVTDARKAASDLYTELRYADAPEDVSADDTRAAWTLGQVCLGYQRMLAHGRYVNQRQKPPSVGTNDDVRRAFAQESYLPLGTVSVLDLDRPMLDAARNGVKSFRQRQKCVAYVRAALSWAAEDHPDESGLTQKVERWWDYVTAGKPDPVAMREIQAKRASHRKHKKELTVDVIAATLKAHEEYCAGRTAENKISPGVRWGLWWVALTATRRLSAVRLLRADLTEFDPEAGAEPGWGVAKWPEDTMKAKIEFFLPIPPIVYGIGAGSIADYTRLVANEHGDWPSEWVFASTRRHGRDAGNDDVGVYPNSLNRHLQRMRAAGALDGIKLFNPHLVRSPLADLIEDRVSGAASSLVLAHSLANERDGASSTTRDSYLTTHRIREKTEGMKVWTETLIESYLRQHGKLPEPKETIRNPKTKPRKA